jgi:hypothetical protein
VAISLSSSLVRSKRYGQIMSRRRYLERVVLAAIAAISIVKFAKKIPRQNSTRISGSATAAEN